MSYWIFSGLPKKIGVTPNKNARECFTFICKDYNVTMDHVRSVSRDSHIVAARQMIAYVLSRALKIKSEDIGLIINRKRITAFYSANKVESDLEFDYEIKKSAEKHIGFALRNEASEIDIEETQKIINKYTNN